MMCIARVADADLITLEIIGASEDDYSLYASSDFHYQSGSYMADEHNIMIGVKNVPESKVSVFLDAGFVRHGDGVIYHPRADG